MRSRLSSDYDYTNYSNVDDESKYSHKKNSRGIGMRLFSISPFLANSRLNFQTFLTLLLILGVILTYLNLSTLHRLIERISSSSDSDNSLSKGRKFALHGNKVDSGYLKHVVEIFESLGYSRTGVQEDWDVLWSHDYPFRTLRDRLLSTSQATKMVNHFPGSGYITNKMNLATSDLPHVPKAFQLPKDKEQLLAYERSNPHKKFVQKSNNHRGIKIEKLENLDLSSNSTFVQEYISNPLLVDGYKFDIGVYTTLVSVSPLKVYAHRDVLFRFCPEQYHPFDPAVIDKYVVGDDYLPIWKVPSLSKYYNDLGFGMRDAFDLWYDKKKGKKASENIWTQVETAIRSVYLQKEKQILEATKKFTGGGKGTNFFEMVRFDFVIDDDGNVYIMEANMSPNLSSAHFPPNQELYRQVLFSLIRLVGLASASGTGTKAVSDSRVSQKHLSVFGKECSSQECEHDCGEGSFRCGLCPHCLSPEEQEALKSTYLTEVRKGDMTRIFPPTNRYSNSTNSLNNFNTKGLTKENKLLLEWFRGKCELDPIFC